MVGTTLIEKLKNGEKQELNKVYVQYREEFIAWLYKSFSVPTDEAKDIYQFSILKFYENVVSGQLKTLSSSLKTYLFAIGKNKALEYNRNMAKKKGSAFDFYLHQLEDTGTAYKEEQLEAIDKGLDALGEPCSRLLKLYYYHKMNLENITKALGYKNYDTAKTQKHKCIQRLKKLSQEWLGKISVS
ncbi:MAG: sigma-70 family RNA polymerase sigma factor [Cyclobacteriaceae bacterium]|nr:sigma-70 family RNA polymerase sigma factor [Cyclobacteriaceae bacterium]